MADWADEMAKWLKGGWDLVGDDAVTLSEALRNAYAKGRAEMGAAAVKACREREEMWNQHNSGLAYDNEAQMREYEAEACADAIEALIAADGDGGSDG